jgi:hypothetical protein
MVVAVVVAAAAAIRNPEHALDGTDRAANHAANHAADGSGNPVTFPRTAHDALGVPELRDREQCKGDGRNGKKELHGHSGRQRRCLDLRLHLNLNSSCSAAIAPTGRARANADVVKRLREDDGLKTRRRDRMQKSTGTPDSALPSPCLRQPVY